MRYNSLQEISLYTPQSSGDLRTFFKHRLQIKTKKIILSSLNKELPKMSKTELIEYICEKNLYHVFANLVSGKKINMKIKYNVAKNIERINVRLSNHDHYFIGGFEFFNKLDIDFVNNSILMKTNSRGFIQHDFSDYKFDYPDLIVKDKIKLYKIFVLMFGDKIKITKQHLNKVFIKDISNIIVKYLYINLPM